ncbi:MAG: acetyl/propionyl/methylcrotonyl-CoA carboxylase subunit alpha [Rhodobacteraceae bacterium]|nr:acetyl/propionyl/methylcrotonyl-CoA carboxylase subunit alpha [Paracoccaceae bacterium]
MAKFEKILIANRGEIALRVIRTARAMGFRTVAVYSDVDHDAPHVIAADEAVRIGPAPVGQSYLNAEALLAAARLTGAEAVHPGYGFLSENAEFARACTKAGLIFIGPTPEAIALMGSKRLSKLAMIDASVPCIPGYQGADQDDETLISEAARIGFPLMIKASAGGGGRGMRIVSAPNALVENIASARSEALSAFGSDELILERAVIGPRHIEIQVFADAHGNVVHLGERDCSIQRRHQKVVEEAPSPFVTPELREKMGTAAINAARACDYRGAGTVEFLVDAEGNFYFLEMNTRLQVEHPVTEAITGLDLVEWQLRVALGEPLPLQQEDIVFSGWAMEVRLYAEDPQNGFLPQTGKILHWHPVEGPGLRLDGGITAGQTISPHYDPMLAKLIAHGSTREETRRKLACAVEDSALLGVPNNKAFLAHILRHPVFAEGAATTDFLARDFEGDPSATLAPPTPQDAALAAMLFHVRSAEASAPTRREIGWRNGPTTPWRYTLLCDEASLSLTLLTEAQHFTVQDELDEVEIELLAIAPHQCTYLTNGVRRTIHFAYDENTVHLDTALGARSFRNTTHTAKTGTVAGGSGHITAPMDGAIVAVHTLQGARVTRGQPLAVLEAMKMEHPLRADIDGTLTALTITEGEQVRIRQHLATISPDTDTDTETPA